MVKTLSDEESVGWNLFSEARAYKDSKKVTLEVLSCWVYCNNI